MRFVAFDFVFLLLRMVCLIACVCCYCGYVFVLFVVACVDGWCFLLDFVASAL